MAAGKTGSVNVRMDPSQNPDCCMSISWHGRLPADRRSARDAAFTNALGKIAAQIIHRTAARCRVPPDCAEPCRTPSTWNPTAAVSMPGSGELPDVESRNHRYRSSSPPMHRRLPPPSSSGSDALPSPSAIPPRPTSQLRSWRAWRGPSFLRAATWNIRLASGDSRGHGRPRISSRPIPATHRLFDRLARGISGPSGSVR